MAAGVAAVRGVGTGIVAGGIVNVWPGMIRLVTVMPFALTSAPSFTPWRQAIPASASPAATVYVDAVEVVSVELDAVAAGVATGPALVDETPFAAAGITAPAGMTSVSPGWITVVIVIEFARSSEETLTR
jgi:hypothetical protein